MSLIVELHTVRSNSVGGKRMLLGMAPAVRTSNCSGAGSKSTFLSDDNSELEPPDPIPNSAVKRFSADGSVGFPHVRVGHRQASTEKAQPQGWAFVFPAHDLCFHGSDHSALPFLR